MIYRQMPRRVCRFLRFFLLVAATMPTLILSGCGFHLQGHAGKLPSELQRLVLQTSSPYSSFTTQLTRRLQEAGVQTVTATDATDSAVLEIFSNDNEQHMLGGGNSVTPTIYQLSYVVRYRLVSAAGATLVGPNIIRPSASISLPANTLIGNSSLVTETQQQLQTRAIDQLLMQLSAPRTAELVRQAQQKSVVPAAAATKPNNAAAS